MCLTVTLCFKSTVDMGHLKNWTAIPDLNVQISLKNNGCCLVEVKMCLMLKHLGNDAVMMPISIGLGLHV